MKVKEKSKSGSIKVDPVVYVEAAKYCLKNGIKMTFFATEAMKEKLQKLNNNGK
jgi:hypothetical protein